MYKSNREAQGRAVKKFVLVGLSLITFNVVGPALAADVPVDPVYPGSIGPGYGVPVPVAYNWTGFYIGANLGGHFPRDEIGNSFFGFVAPDEFVDTTSATSLSPKGVIAGMQIGYNWHVGRMFVGLEFDANWLSGSATGSVSLPVFTPADVMTNTVKGQFLTTVRPRVGVVLDRWLIYATGGLAFETFITNDTFTVTGGVTGGLDKRNTRTGETIGLGVEYAVLDSWTLKAEYLYLNYGSFDTFIPTLPITVHHQIVDNVARIGINHRFPVYWKY
jgi:outer membrane immunogenic protein